MWPIVLFLLFAALLLGVVYALWRYWDNLSRLSPEEEAFDKRVAALNERQANRISDEQLAQPISEDDAWGIMVNRGQRGRGGSDRYSGMLTRRARERRRRS